MEKHFTYLFIAAFAAVVVVALATLYSGCNGLVRLRLTHDGIEFVSEGCSRASRTYR